MIKVEWLVVPVVDRYRSEQYLSLYSYSAPWSFYYYIRSGVAMTYASVELKSK